MAEKKKRKSIYDKPLKDINKDGKVNFGDTWLGDALGFDGKLGVQKGRPGLKESLKGARRGKAESESSGGRSPRPQARPAKPSSRLESKGETPKGPRSSKGGPARYRGRSSATTDAGMDQKAARTNTPNVAPKPPKVNKPKPSPKPDSTRKPTNAVERVISDAKTNQADARAKAIQTSKTEAANKPSEAEIQAWIKTQPAQFHRANKTEEAKRAAAIRALKPKSGMSMGGMARYQQNGGRDMKKSGMFYKSGSPKGYK